MKYTSVRITRGATVNLGNYESARVEIALEVELEEGDNAGAVRYSLSDEATEWLRNEVEAIQDAAGLPPRGADRFTG